MKKLLLFLPVVIFLSSCTITKRVHRKGYHVSSNSNINIKKKKRPHKTVGYSKKKGTKHLNEKNKIRKDSVVDNNPTNLRVLKSDLPNSSNTNKKNSKKIEIHNVKSTGLREKNESPKTFILNEISEKKTNNEEGITSAS